MSSPTQSNVDAKAPFPKKLAIRGPFPAAGATGVPEVCRKVDVTLTHDGTGHAVLAPLDRARPGIPQPVSLRVIRQPRIIVHRLVA